MLFSMPACSTIILPVCIYHMRSRYRPLSVTDMDMVGQSRSISSLRPEPAGHIGSARAQANIGSARAQAKSCDYADQWCGLFDNSCDSRARFLLSTHPRAQALLSIAEPGIYIPGASLRRARCSGYRPGVCSWYMWLEHSTLTHSDFSDQSKLNKTQIKKFTWVYYNMVSRAPCSLRAPARDWSHSPDNFPWHHV